MKKKIPTKALIHLFSCLLGFTLSFPWQKQCHLLWMRGVEFVRGEWYNREASICQRFKPTPMGKFKWSSSKHYWSMLQYYLKPEISACSSPCLFIKDYLKTSHPLLPIMKEMSSSSILHCVLIVSLESVCIGKLPREHFIGHIQF